MINDLEEVKNTNLEIRPLHIAARVVELCLGSWIEKVDITITPRDEYHVINV